MFKTIVTADQLARHLDDPGWVIVDCRFALADTSAGRRAYEAGHIPGAVYAHLDHDLSGPPLTDHGRHPLPAPAALIATFKRLGIGNDSQVVAYDDAGGMVAGRLWWLLRYLGHEAVALLDGGWAAWQADDRPVRAGVEQMPAANFQGTARDEWLVCLGDVMAEPLLVDSRAPERYRGEVEPLDPRAGHIPGARNYHYRRNLDENGRLKAPAELRAQLSEVLAATRPEQAVFYCGSGVSACLNLLAMEHAGLPAARLYAGSWSEWSADPQRPAASGEEG